MTDANPTVNRYLKNEHFDHIDHALGRPAVPTAETYRNYFAIDEDTKLSTDFRASPHWHHRGTRDGMAYFNVTDAGREALAKHLSDIGSAVRLFAVSYDGFTANVAAKTHGAAKYAHWKHIADTCDWLQFGEFRKDASVRLAAPLPTIKAGA